MRLCLILLIFILECAAATDQAEVRTIAADEFIAYILPVGNEDRIAIRRYEPRDLAELSLFSSDNQHGGRIEEIKWSEDRKYLVFSTSSSGGHSPWHFPTYVFSTERWAFVLIDDTLPAVADKSFSFTDSSHIKVMTLKKPDSVADDFVSTTIDLNALPWKKHKP